MSAKSEPIQYRKTDWIIYWDDSGKRRDPIRCCAVGSKEAAMCNAPMLKGFRGTYPEASAEVKKMNAKYRITKKKGRPKKYD